MGGDPIERYKKLLAFYKDPIPGVNCHGLFDKEAQWVQARLDYLLKQ